jgi:hypothetical protein
MISWTIPTQKSTTGSTVFTSSDSATATDAFAGYSTSGSRSRSTSFGLSATTYYDAYSTNVFYGADPTLPEYNITTNSADITVVSAATASVQTSTTTAQEFNIYTVTSSEIQTSVWTTISEASSIAFVLTEATSSEWYPEVISQGTTTIESTTYLTQTQSYGEQATVVQANTLLAQNAEIIYTLDPATGWSGYSAATQEASSGTRFTIAPSYLTSQSPVVNGTILSTSSVINSVVSGSIQWQGSTTTQTTITTVFPQFTGVVLIQLPLATATRTHFKVITTQRNTDFTVFSQETVTFNIGGVTRATTSTVIESWGASITTVQRQFADQTFQTTIQTTASTTRASTTAVAASASSSYASSPVVNLTEAAASGVTANCNQYIYGTPQVTVNKGGSFARSKFVTTGAQIGSSRGGWFTAADSFVLPVALAGGGLRGVTIFPTTYQGNVTAYSNSVTYTKEVGTGTTTSSNSIGLNGNFITTTQNTNQSFVNVLPRPVIAGAGLLPQGMTIVDVAGVGVYKDAINGSTTSFSGAATAYTEAQSANISCWQPIVALSPPVVRLERTPIYWIEPRNLSSPPPDA